MLVRYSVGMFMGLLVTAVLFYIMQGLIRDDRVMIEDPPRTIRWSYLTNIDDIEVPKKPPKPVRPPEIEKPPEQPQTAVTVPGGNRGIVPVIRKIVSKERKVVLGGLSDGSYLPIVKVSPVYPRRALQRGIEGYVTLQFTVSKTGAVENPVVVDSQPSGIFDRAAIKAALRFKYKPKVRNGVAVPVSGVTNMISFRINS